MSLILISQYTSPLKSAIVLASTILIVGCDNGMHSNTTSSDAKANFSSAGEQIYYTGRSLSGDMIVPVGGHHHVQMHGGGCASCHGVNREGGAKMWPWFWVTAPALTPSALLGDHEDEGHNHEVYDTNSLKKAITQGISPAGEILDESMPRWQMSIQDLDDLIQYLILENLHSDQ